jgi:hypothetical protein
MRVEAWVKFHDYRQPELYTASNFIELWDAIKDHVLKRQVRIDWLVIT